MQTDAPFSRRHLRATYWFKLTAGLFACFAVLQGTATVLESDRGQAGLLVGLLVVVSTLAVERLFFQGSLATAARALGLGRPLTRGLAVAGVIGLLLPLVILTFARLAPASLAFEVGWAWLIPGLFAQAGIAEEIVFRGYLFGHLRRERSFWRAATLATLPFVVVHLLLFATMPWPIALAAIVLSVAVSFPLAHLFELGGDTIWAPAFLHFVVQGALKIIVVSGESDLSLPLLWMAASAAVPFAVFLVPVRRGGDA